MISGIKVQPYRFSTLFGFSFRFRKLKKILKQASPPVGSNPVASSTHPSFHSVWVAGGEPFSRFKVEPWEIKSGALLFSFRFVRAAEDRPRLNFCRRKSLSGHQLAKFSAENFWLRCSIPDTRQIVGVLTPDCASLRSGCRGSPATKLLPPQKFVWAPARKIFC